MLVLILLVVLYRDTITATGKADIITIAAAGKVLMMMDGGVDATFTVIGGKHTFMDNDKCEH